MIIVIKNDSFWKEGLNKELSSWQELSNFESFAHDGCKFLYCNVKKFPDGETSVKISDDESCDKAVGLISSDQKVFLIYSLYPNVNDSLIELLFIIDGLKRIGANFVSVIVPYFPYSRQERLTNNASSISAKVICDIICSTGADQIVTFDVHSLSIEAFFNKKNFVNLNFACCVPKVNEEKVGGKEKIVVVAPDIGSIKRSRKFANMHNYKFTVIDKSRDFNNGNVEAERLIGDSVDGMYCIIVDDIISSGSTLCKAALLLKKFNALYIEAIITHPVFSGDAVKNILDSEINSLKVCNTIDVSSVVIDNCGKIQKISIEKIILDFMLNSNRKEAIIAYFNDL